MKITLITPCLNAAATIERTLKSVELQNYADLEYIICDGGSTDGTLDIIARYSHIVDRVISEKDKNVADAINKGFRLGTGEVRAYLNADDAFTPHAFSDMKRVFSESPEVDVVTGGCLRVFADSTELVTQVPDRYLRVLALRNDIEQPSTFWRTTAHLRAGQFDESFYLAFDWEWWNRLKANGCRFHRTDSVISIYYFSDSNLTSRGGARIINEMYRVTRKYGSHAGLSAYLYKFLFHFFDMRGYYDCPFEQLSQRKQKIFGSSLRLLSRLFGEEVVHSYNWNWASKQIRNLKWY